MVIHAVIKVGHPVGVVDRRSFNSDFMYVIGGQPYSLTIVRNGILRSNRRAPYALVKSFGGGDKRLEVKMIPSFRFVSELCTLEKNKMNSFYLCD